MNRKTKTELFLELAKPNKQGISRWVDVKEFKNEYSELTLGNGGSWLRKNSTLEKKYIVETNKNITKGNKIDAIKLNGFNTKENFNQTIRGDIIKKLKKKNCVILGINSSTETHKIEIDHKDGRKENQRISNIITQKIEDFQPLCKSINNIKRQICIECKRTGIRFDAKKIEGNPVSYYKGDKYYNEKIGCEGCYWYDPVEYRKKTYNK